jgi:hypothetical protein
MSTAQRQTQGRNRLKTERVDLVASLLLSSLIVVGAFVFLLFLYWLTQTFSWQSGSIRIEREQIAGRGDHAAGFERDIEPPGSEEVELLELPSLEESLEAVTDIATSVAASLETLETDALSTVGDGRGDDRPPGPLGEGDDIVPRYERWELKFQAKGSKDYANQLDYFRIELACVGGGENTVEYASNFSGPPRKRLGTPEEENQLQRLYFIWRTENPLKQFDSQLLAQAGVRTQGRQIMKFIPKALEDQLAQIELQYARSQGRGSVREIAKTVFESKSSGQGFEFSVIEQLYRNVAQ